MVNTVKKKKKEGVVQHVTQQQQKMTQNKTWLSLTGHFSLALHVKAAIVDHHIQILFIAVWAGDENKLRKKKLA